ncbi:MAG TPA: biopolymer transporter ExbD [Elusimicrobiota bacterium]|nr:biopolymer transporter ExbD [Elusimicrobiota bacterium]
MPSVTHHSKSKKLLTEINMVPFIDIVLVLLIIFMIMSPFLAQTQITINLPKAVSHDSTVDDAPIKIQVTKDGQFYLQGQRVARAKLEGSLQRSLKSNSSKTVLIEADKDVLFDHVVYVLDLTKKQEAVKVGVGVRDPSAQ